MIEQMVEGISSNKIFQFMHYFQGSSCWIDYIFSLSVHWQLLLNVTPSCLLLSTKLIAILSKKKMWKEIYNLAF